MLKTAAIWFFRWLVEKGYFGKVELSALVHDRRFVVFKLR